jgi:hypothetical protein
MTRLSGTYKNADPTRPASNPVKINSVHPSLDTATETITNLLNVDLVRSNNMTLLGRNWGIHPIILQVDGWRNCEHLLICEEDEVNSIRWAFAQQLS